MARTRNADDDRQRLVELEQLARTAGRRIAPTEADDEIRINRIDDAFQSAIRNLRPLKHIQAARDALKLVRQAQNLMLDAEDDLDPSS